MEIANDRPSIARRFVEIQELAGMEGDNRAFADLLNGAAKELGLPAEWNPGRVSKLRGGMQGLSPEDNMVIARVDPKRRGYTWPAFGIPVAAGDDPWDVLARNAKRRKAG